MMACCSRGVRGMLMAGKCNRFLCVPEQLAATRIRILLRIFAGWRFTRDNEVMEENKQ